MISRTNKQHFEEPTCSDWIRVNIAFILNLCSRHQLISCDVEELQIQHSGQAKIGFKITSSAYSQFARCSCRLNGVRLKQIHECHYTDSVPELFCLIRPPFRTSAQYSWNWPEFRIFNDEKKWITTLKIHFQSLESLDEFHIWSKYSNKLG